MATTRRSSRARLRPVTSGSSERVRGRCCTGCCTSHAPAPRLYLRAWRAPEWTRGVAGLCSVEVESRDGWRRVAAAWDCGRPELRSNEPLPWMAATARGLGLGARRTVASGERALSRCNILLKPNSCSEKNTPTLPANTARKPFGAWPCAPCVATVRCSTVRCSTVRWTHGHRNLVPTLSD